MYDDDGDDDEWIIFSVLPIRFAPLVTGGDAAIVDSPFRRRGCDASGSQDAD